MLTFQPFFDAAQKEPYTVASNGTPRILRLEHSTRKTSFEPKTGKRREESEKVLLGLGIIQHSTIPIIRGLHLLTLPR